jgi:chromosome segregation ATPase
MAKTDWKSKATENARDKKRLNKRIRELTTSRDEWKTKSIAHKARADKLASDLKKLKTRLNELVDFQ